MRPKLVFLIMMLVECFLLGMVVAPGVVHPGRLVEAEHQYAHSHSVEAAQKVHNERARARKFQVFLLVAAALVLVGIIFYLWERKL